MIVRNIDGIIKIIGNIHDEDEFIRLNPTSGFIKVDDLPYSRYGNYKIDGDEIVVDTDKEAVAASLQYRDDRQYPGVKEQLDMLWHAMDEDASKRLEPFYTNIKTVKDSNPK
tara:strand:+ start:1809 stop:2144 length:336 start_codon:yes stop_codon:yes gene_type:complete